MAFNNVDYIYKQEYMYGKKEKSVIQKPIHIGGKFTFPTEFESSYTSSEVMHQLVGSIVQQLVDNNQLEVRKQYDPQHNSYIFETRVAIAPLTMTNIATSASDVQFEYLGQYWSRGEIEQALENTFPEKFV